jgi:hypothetical protein
MSRTKGALNKPKQNGGVYITSFLEKQIQGASVNKENPMGWINYGAKNNFPYLLLDLYANSPTHHAAVDFGVNSIVGAGVDYEEMKIDGSQIMPNPYETWENLIRSLSLDFILYGSYALQVIMNKDGKTYSFYHTPFEKVRFAPYDEDGQITKYFICSDWTQPSKNPPITIEAFDMLDSNKLKKGVPYLYVYRPYSPTSSYYPAPHYTAAIKAIQSEVEYLNYDLKSIINGFVPSGMLILNEVENDQERDTIIRNVQSMFTGSENANTLMISFRRNQEETAPQFVPFNIDSKADKYNYANDRTISRILAGHQIPSPLLVGLPDIGKSGFSSEADKLETSYQLYNRLVGDNNRIAIVKTLNVMLAMNGVDVEIILKPLKFNDFGAEDDKSTETTATEKNIDTNEGNIEEKVE